MNSINSVVTVFSNLFANHGATLLNGILIITTIGGQSLIKRLTFACPCAYPLNVLHSAVFMIGPTMALFIVGIMLNTSTWKLVHGSCFRVNETRHSFRTVIVTWIELIIQSSIAPVAWLFVVLLDGGYYRCLLSHRVCAMSNAIICKNETILATLRSSATFDSQSGHGEYCPPCICDTHPTDGSFLEAESQVFAWFLLVGYGLATMLVICFYRICDKYTLVQRHYVELYKEEEKLKFDLVAREHAAKLAERNARAFFSESDWTKRDWDCVGGIPEINNPMFARLRIIAAQKTQTTMYTPLQLWNDQKGYRILKPDVLDNDESQGIIIPDSKED